MDNKELKSLLKLPLEEQNRIVNRMSSAERTVLLALIGKRMKKLDAVLRFLAALAVAIVVALILFLSGIAFTSCKCEPEPHLKMLNNRYAR